METRAVLLTFGLQADRSLCALLPSEIIPMEAFCPATGSREGIWGRYLPTLLTSGSMLAQQ